MFKIDQRVIGISFSTENHKLNGEKATIKSIDNDTGVLSVKWDKPYLNNKYFNWFFSYKFKIISLDVNIKCRKILNV